MASNIEKRLIFIRVFSWVLVPVMLNFLFMGLVYSQAQADTVKLTNYSQISLAEPWKVMKGNNFEFENPGYDDSQTIEELPNEQRELSTQLGHSWYRKWVYLPDDKPALNFGLETW